MLSRLIITFLPRSKHVLISWLQSPSAVILESPKMKSATVSTYLPWCNGTRCHDLSFLNVEFKPTFSLSSFTFIKRLFSSSLSAIRQKLPLVVFININCNSTPACGSVVKNLPANAGDAGSTPTLGRSPQEGNGDPLQCSCLENPTDSRVWWATVHGVAKSWTQLSMHTRMHKVTLLLLWTVLPLCSRIFFTSPRVWAVSPCTRTWTNVFKVHMPVFPVTAARWFHYPLSWWRGRLACRYYVSSQEC